MNKKTLSLALALTVLFSTVVNVQFRRTLDYVGAAESLTSQESQVVALVNGTNAYRYDLELEKIALNHSVSGYSFRSGGSAGATATAMWLRDKLVSFGLDVSLESFDFTNWNLPIQPILIVDEDGDNSTTNDQTLMSSFQYEHYSWPTPEGGVFADLVVLPLPSAASFDEISTKPIDSTLWDIINTTGKIVLIGREVRQNHGWEEIYETKLSAQPPAAVVYTWWYPWNSFVPPFFSSSGGLPLSSLGTYYWNSKIPTGWLSYGDGLWIREREDSANISAAVSIPSVVGTGPHYNVVGKLVGDQQSKFVIISGHYDTVMTSGFVDNGAGTSGVLELARVFTEAAKNSVYNSNYTLVFVAFASEELGLIGSSNYVMQHKAEMKDIVAVVNLDSIGSDNLEVTRTSPSRVLDLDEIVFKAAGDLNVNITETGIGSSDQEAFRDPLTTGTTYSMVWSDYALTISDAAPVESSVMLVSSPLLYSDKWNKTNPGWIHTAYDNSTSTQTLNWLEPDSFEGQIKVAALSAMRISPSSQIVDARPPLFLFLVLGVALAAVVVTVVYFVKVRKPPIKTVAQ